MSFLPNNDLIIQPLRSDLVATPMSVGLQFGEHGRFGYLSKILADGTIVHLDDSNGETFFGIVGRTIRYNYRADHPIKEKDELVYEHPVHGKFYLNYIPTFFIFSQTAE